MRFLVLLQEPQALRVRPIRGGSDGVVHVVLIVPAIRQTVWADDHDRLTPKQMHGEHQRRTRRRSPGAGVAAGSSRHRRGSPSIASGSMRRVMHVTTASPRAARPPAGSLIRRRVLVVAGQHVGEVSSSESRPKTL